MDSRKKPPGKNASVVRPPSPDLRLLACAVQRQRVPAMSNSSLDQRQAAAAAQFERQSDRYGKSHILADTADMESALEGINPSPYATALDVATGGGHAAVFLARHGWKVTAGDIAPRMLVNAKGLATEAGFQVETRLFPAEKMPFLMALSTS